MINDWFPEDDKPVSLDELALWRRTRPPRSFPEPVAPLTRKRRLSYFRARYLTFGLGTDGPTGSCDRGPDKPA